jgi:hypothetical protein
MNSILTHLRKQWDYITETQLAVELAEKAKRQQTMERLKSLDRPTLDSVWPEPVPITPEIQKIIDSIPRPTEMRLGANWFQSKRDCARTGDARHMREWFDPIRQHILPEIEKMHEMQGYDS